MLGKVATDRTEQKDESPAQPFDEQGELGASLVDRLVRMAIEAGLDMAIEGEGVSSSVRILGRR